MTTWPQPPTPEIAALIRRIGSEAAWALVERCGGTRVYVPREGGTVLEGIIGPAAVAALAERHGGEHYDVPVAREWRILVLHSRGLSAPAIARTLSCHVRTVYRTLDRARPTTQMDLFRSA